MKRVLILGSTGFIGGHLVKFLRDQGHWVKGVGRNIRYDIFKPNKFASGDLRDINFVESLFNEEFEFDEVYQFAADMGGATYINKGDNDGIVMSNSVIINCNVAKCVVKYNVKKLFFASSACVYPSTNDVATCNEEEAYPALPDNAYGWEKIFSERLYKSFQKQFGLDIRIARLHTIVGDYQEFKNERSKSFSSLAYKVACVEDNGTIEVIGDGTQIRSFLYIKDCIKAIQSLMYSNFSEPVNIGSEELITINEYLEILKKISGKNFKIKYVDGPIGIKYRYCPIDKLKVLCNWSPDFNIIETTKITYNFILANSNI